MLPAFEAGSGPRGVVLVHEAGADLCGWWSYAAHLSRIGFHVLLFDDRCAGEAPCRAGYALTRDVTAAVASLRARGARHVALVGASRGGAVVLAAAASPPPGVTAVATLSADELGALVSSDPPRTAEAAASRVRVPSLLAVARRDRYVGVTETRTLAARVPGDVRLVVLAASAGHGWNILPSADLQVWSPFARTLQAFLTRHL